MDIIKSIILMTAVMALSLVAYKVAAGPTERVYQADQVAITLHKLEYPDNGD